MTKDDLANENLPRVPEAKAPIIFIPFKSIYFRKKKCNIASHHYIHSFLKFLVSCIVNEAMYPYSYGNPGTEVSLKEVYFVSGRSMRLYASNSGFRANYM